MKDTRPVRDPESKTTRPAPEHLPSNTDTLPEKYPTKQQESRGQVYNHVHRNASHAKDRYTKASPVNTSRPDRNVSFRSGHPSTKSTKPSRPGFQTAASFQTHYMEMLLSLDTIPRLHNILVSFFAWVLLAGFVVWPGTFTSIEDLTDDPEAWSSSAANAVLNRVKNVPLVIVGAVCCTAGTTGMVWLSVRWRKNYVWLLNRLFLPGAMNGLAGLISTLVTVYTQADGDWSIMAKITAIVEGSALGICGLLFVIFNNLLLRWIKMKHGREVEKMQAEGFLEKTERKLHEPALEPGSVV
ncbi:uncharacterized protein BCR38DRAFT_424291 [Pseudomassariella vexata]|uniref:Uncharacterized protein n=1 Tax=Pseudomassariella vexata TaxID=1141098 RepID=A0A1Y2EB19_9PEZI|nr:uncharacterized protein BCR38DRAFT_424291 [Pseudomassariella vexata]ORY68773.1 hypothetical protein BCR38DRAFT_424291 [Pseudomassariella vexata]